MSTRDALVALRSVRLDDDIVVTTMGAAREWMLMGSHPLDLVLVPSAMGHATSFGLGLALAQPARRVIVCNGDGSMLMNLGSLATIAAESPPNLVVIVFGNGVYEVTGGQAIPITVDFGAVAHACGFRSLFHYAEIDAWRTNVAGILNARGPTLVVLAVDSVAGTPAPRSPGPAGARAEQFRESVKRQMADVRFPMSDVRSAAL